MKIAAKRKGAGCTAPEAFEYGRQDCEAVIVRGTDPGRRKEEVTHWLTCFSRPVAACRSVIVLGMLARLILTIACMMSCSVLANARPILWSCHTVLDRSGEVSSRVIMVDPDRRIISDQSMTWIEDLQSPMAAGLDEFVRMDPGLVQWGNRHKGGGMATSTFTLNLGTGRYSLVDVDDGQLSHGICTRSDQTS